VLEFQCPAIEEILGIEFTLIESDPLGKLWNRTNWRMKEICVDVNGFESKGDNPEGCSEVVEGVMVSVRWSEVQLESSCKWLTVTDEMILSCS
jgi:hypothetical protein